MSVERVPAPAISRPVPTAVPLPIYVGVVYALTWTCWIPVVLWSKHWPSQLPSLVWLAGVFMPGSMAVALTAFREGGPGVAALLSRMVQFRGSVRWYIFAFAFTAAIKLTAAIIVRLETGSWPAFGHEGPLLILIATLLSVPVQAGEEVGWRGYLLPRLANKFGYAWASVIVGAIWAGWHLPQFFLPGADTFGQSFPLWCIEITALSVAITWLYIHTRGSIFFAMLMHAAINNTKDIVPSQNPDQTNPMSLHASPVMYATTLLLCACAAGFLAKMPRIARAAQSSNP